MIASGALAELDRQHRRVPADISVIGMEAIEFARISLPALSTVKQPFQDMCEQAILMIMQQVREEKLSAQRIVLARACAFGSVAFGHAILHSRPGQDSSSSSTTMSMSSGSG